MHIFSHFKVPAPANRPKLLLTDPFRVVAAGALAGAPDASARAKPASGRGLARGPPPAGRRQSGPRRGGHASRYDRPRWRSTQPSIRAAGCAARSRRRSPRRSPSRCAACGSSHSSGTTIDPASDVPASAALYAGATVRPDGSLQSAARAAGRALTHQADPYLRLLGALQTPGSPALDFQRDVAPWLGPHAGVFLGSTGGSQGAAVSRIGSLLQQGLLGSSTSSGAFPFAAHGVQGAILLDTSDAAKARSFVASQARRAGAHGSAYRGISYQVTAGGIAFAIVERLVVIGSEPGLHQVIDTASGGPTLEHAAGYSKLLAAAPPGVLAHVYANPGALEPAGTSEGGRAWRARSRCSRAGAS